VSENVAQLAIAGSEITEQSNGSTAVPPDPDVAATSQQVDQNLSSTSRGSSENGGPPDPVNKTVAEQKAGQPTSSLKQGVMKKHCNNAVIYGFTFSHVEKGIEKRHVQRRCASGNLGRRNQFVCCGGDKRPQADGAQQQ